MNPNDSPCITIYCLTFLETNVDCDGDTFFYCYRVMVLCIDKSNTED